MNTLSDQQLLREYARRRSEPAFAELLRRHVDLVYSAARRMVCDNHLAEDVTQSVFVALAQNAGKLADRPVLAGWLHRTAQNLAANIVRSEVRRRAREQEAAAMNEPSQPDALWESLAPHLDSALGELSETDRDAVLLRYFQRKSASEMAQALGISDEAAQKRVSRAVERLRDCLIKRGLTVGAAGLAAAISTQAVRAAPAGLAASISASAGIAAAAVQTAAVEATTQVIIMTTTQKVLIAATLAAAVGTGIYQTHRASELNTEVQALQQQQARLEQQIENWQQERERTAIRLQALLDDNERLRRDAAEVPGLRGQVARLRTDSQELARLRAQEEFNPTAVEMKSWLARVDDLKGWLEQRPEAGIPDFELLTERDWLNAAREKIETEEDYRRAMSRLRSAASGAFAKQLSDAATAYSKANPGRFPAELAELQPYFEVPAGEAILDRWQIKLAEDMPSLRMGGNWVITQKAPVDAEYDPRFAVGARGSYGSAGGSRVWDDGPDPDLAAMQTLTPALEAFKADHRGNEPAHPDELVPYIATEAERAAFEQLMQLRQAEKP